MNTVDNIANSIDKKILLISYHFPPSVAIGGQRIVNFAKYLRLYGWETSVLTVEDRYFDAVDWERVEEVETIQIIKAGQLPKLIKAYRNIKETYYRIRKKYFVAQQNPVRPNHSLNLGSPILERLPQKIKRYVISLFLTLPDTERSWVLPAVFRALREIKNEKINCILTTCPPYSTHLIGLLVKLMVGVKWIADFRDPWMTAGTKLVFTCALSNKIESFLEKNVIQKADLVTFNSPRLRDAYKEKYATEPAGKFACILNGIDVEGFSKIRSLKKYQKFTLSYTGIFYADRSPEPIFRAMNQLLLEEKVSLSEINVKLVGSCQSVNGKPIFSIIRAYGLESVVEVIDQVPRVKALEIIGKSHVALLLAPNQPFQIPSKVYDYIGTGTKILAITEEGATFDMIQSTNCGKAFAPSNIQGIKEFISQTMTNKTPISENHPSNISKFDARRVSADLSDVLNRICYLKGE